MAKYLNLQIPQACNQDWNTLLPDQKGKFCLSCQRKVIDFTTMNDRDLLQFFRNHNGPTCGRFNSVQLGKDLLIPKKKIPWLRYLFQFTIPAFLLSLKSSGQSTSKLKQDTEMVRMIQPSMGTPVVVVQKGTIATNPYTIQGTVKDNTGNAVAGASIIIKGTHKGVAADRNGHFSLEVIGTRIVVEISAVGYSTQEIQIPAGQTEVDVTMSPQIMGFVGEVVVVRSRSAKKQKKAEKKEVCVKPLSPTLSVFPNPVATNSPLHLKWQNLPVGNYSIEIYNLSGALVQSQQLEVKNRMNEFLLEPKLMAGNYVMSVREQKTGMHLSKQVIVQ